MVHDSSHASDPPRSEVSPPSVLDSVEDGSEEAPRILLRDSDKEESGRFVDSQAASDLVPRGRGNYEIHGEIARGGMGQIIKARDTDLGREVAIKVLDSKLAERPFALRRFIEEAQIGGQLQHPGVVPVYEMGMMRDERPYFAMKLVKGRTLSALLQQRKEHADDRRRHLAIFESVCQTVAYAHSKGVIHRDLKPANIMVGAFGEVLVVDWGLAKVVGQGGVEDEKRARQSNLTVIETVRSGPGSSGSDSVVGSVMGTPAYMPPEQALGEIARLDERADVFALGAILCEILTGLPPYVEGDNERVAVLAAQARLDSARERIEICQADRELKELCLECLTPAPGARPRNADEVAERIHGFLAGLEEKAHAAELAAAEARVKAAGERRARRLTLGLALATIVALVAVGGAFFWAGAKEQERLAEARRAFDESQSEALALQQEGRLPDALEAARASVAALAAAELADEALLERGERTVERIEELLRAARVRADLDRRNAKLVARLEVIRMDQIDAFLAARFGDFDQLFLDAFRDYGLDLGDEDFVEEFEVLRDSGIAAQVVAALDDWARIRRKMQSSPLGAERLTMLAIDLDPIDRHTAAREAIMRGQREELLEIAAGAVEADLGPELVWAIGGTLFDMREFEESRAILDRACRRYRHDFILNQTAGFVFTQIGRPDRALPLLEAAIRLRPGSAFAHSQLGLVRMDAGQLDRAEAVLREAVRLDPELERAQLGLGWALWLLGDLDESLEHLRRGRELHPSNAETVVDIVAVEYLLGEVEADVFVGHIEGFGTADAGTLASWAGLVFERPGVADDVARRVQVIADEIRALGPDRWDGRAIQATAALRLGDARRARAIVARADREAVTPNQLTLADLDYLRAEISHALGEASEAHEWFELAETRRRFLTRFRAKAWERSLLVRHRNRVAELLGL